MFPQEWRVVPHESIANREQWNFENGALCHNSALQIGTAQIHKITCFFLVIVGVIYIGMYFKSEKGNS